MLTMTNIECQPVKQIYCKLIMLTMTNIECQPVKKIYCKLIMLAMTNIECQPVKHIYCNLTMLTMTNIECQPVKSKIQKTIVLSNKNKRKGCCRYKHVTDNLHIFVVRSSSYRFIILKYYIVINRITTCVPINYKHELVQYKLTFLH